MSEIDSLQININATATKANDALDNLIKKLDRLTTSLSSIDGSKLNGLASGVSQLGTAMQTMNAVKTSDFTRLAKNLSNLNSLDTSKLSGVSANISKIGTAVSGLSGVSQGVSQITELANGIKQLGYKSADKAIDNIPKLATSMKQLMKELSTAPKVSQNLIDMTNALAKLARTGASSGKAAQSLSNSFTGIYKSSGFAVSGIKKVNARLVSLIRSIAPVVGLVKLIDFGKQAMEISSDLTEVQNVVDVTFGDYKQKIEDLANVSIPELGMSELSVKQIGSRFQAMGTAMGFSTEKMADMSVELTRLTGDMASFYNVEQETMGKALQSIFTGETEPMRKYGIDLTNATIQQYALSQGITTSINKMTQLEKAQLRYNYVVAQTTAAQGDFIRTQDTWANQIRILKENLKQLASIIGGSLINAFKPLVQAINSAMSHIISFAQTVSNALGKIFGWKFEVGGGGVTNDLETGADAADDIASGMDEAADSAKKLKSNLLAIDELNVLNPDTDTSTSGGISGNLGSGSASGGEWVQQDSIFKDFESEIDSLYELGEYIGKVLTDMMNNIDWEKVYEKARNFGTGLADFLNGLISPELFGAVGRTIAGALNTAIYAALSFGETFDWVNLGESIAEGINQFFEKFDFKSLAKTINTWVKGIWTTLKTAVAKIKWKTVFKGIYDFIDEIDLGAVFVLAIPNMKTFKTLAKALSKEFEELKKNVLNIAEMFSGGFFSGLENFRNSLSSLQKIGITAATGFLEFKAISDTFENLTLGTENLITSIAKIGGTVAIAGASMTAVLGFPTGIVATAIVGLIGMFKGLGDAEKELIEQSEIEKYGDTISNLTSRIRENSKAVMDRATSSLEYVQTTGISEAQMASDLAEKYFELAGKESLTNEEKEKMKNLASSLVNTLPELQNYYNSETGLLDATKESIDALIQSRLKEIQLSAVEEELKKAYEDQITQQKELKTALELSNISQEEMNELQKEYKDLISKQDALAEYQRLSDEIIGCYGDTTELLERQKELWNILTNEGQETFPTFEILGQQISIAEQNLLTFQEKYEGALGSLSEAKQAYESVNGNIEELTEMLVSGMEGAAGDAVSGYANGLEDGKKLIEEANELIINSGIDSVKTTQDSHSPSKVYENLAKDAVDGYNLGIINNQNSTKSIIENWMNVVLETMEEKWNGIRDWWNNTAMVSLFDESIIPNFGYDKWNELLENGMFLALQDKWYEFRNDWDSWLELWEIGSVIPYFGYNAWYEILTKGMVLAISNQTKNFISDWNKNVNNWWNTNVLSMFKYEKWYNMLGYTRNAFSASFSEIYSTINRNMENSYNSVSNWCSKMISKLESVLSKIAEVSSAVASAGSVGVSYSISNVSVANLTPTPFAKGGIITRPTFSLIGEAGPEAVIPLSENSEWISRVAEQINSNNSNGSDDLLREQNELLRQQNELLSYLADKEIIATLDTSRETIRGFRNAEKRLGFSFT